MRFSLLFWLGVRMHSRLVILILTSHPLVSTYAPPTYTICHCSDHDSTFCPYYISYEGFTRFSSMIEEINKQQLEFATKTMEYNLTHETDLRFSSPKLNVCLYDNGVPFSPLESRIQAILDPP